MEAALPLMMMKGQQHLISSRRKLHHPTRPNSTRKVAKRKVALAGHLQRAKSISSNSKKARGWAGLLARKRNSTKNKQCRCKCRCRCSNNNNKSILISMERRRRRVWMRMKIHTARK
jgi:hypothetical protein